MLEDDERREVVVVDVRIPFISMVMLMVKWAIAAIPALLILAALGMVLTVLLGGLLTGGMRHM